MKIFLKVKPNSKEDKVEKISENKFIVQVKAPPKEGKANEAVIKLLSGYLDVPRSRISIIQGQHSRNKIASIT